jgi:YD repeat-containing protein
MAGAIAISSPSAASDAEPLRIVVELASIPVGSLRLPIRTTPEESEAPTGGSSGEDAASSPLEMPEIAAEGSRFLLRGADAGELTPTASETARDPDAEYRVDPPGAFPTALRRGAGDDTEWTLRGRDGLERALRVVAPGAARWRVAALRDPTSGATVALAYDPSGRIERITTADGLEWRLEYEAVPVGLPIRLAQVTARTPINAGGEVIYRARLDYVAGPSGRARLERVRAASRVPAAVLELAFVYAPPEVPGAGPPPRERLREVLTPRGEIEPRFEYDGRTATVVFSAVPTVDAYDDRYRVTARLAPEYVGDDLLDDALGRHTIAFDDAMRERHRLRVKDGLLLTSDSTPLDTAGLLYLVVLAPDGELYAAPGDFSSTTKVHHSSVLAGAPVAAAGEIVARRGKLVRVTSRSGHYKPPMCLLDQLRAELERRGVPLDGVPFEKGY